MSIFNAIYKTLLEWCGFCKTLHVAWHYKNLSWVFLIQPALGRSFCGCFLLIVLSSSQLLIWASPRVIMRITVLFAVYDRAIEAGKDAEWLALAADEGPK